MKLDTLTVPCPVCHSMKVRIDDQETQPWGIFDFSLSCDRCDATFTATYTFWEVGRVRYGTPIGPVYLTDDPQQAIAAWEAEGTQWIVTDGTSYTVGYAPTLLDDGRREDPRWRDTSPEELEALLAQV